MTNNGLFGPLDPDLLYVGVFGPGVGENIILRIPPDNWFIVDGCLIKGKSPAAEVLRHHHARWSGILLTHPHHDHVLGLVDLFDFEGGGLVGCADLSLVLPERWISSPDANMHLMSGAVEDALSAILDRWERYPEEHWLVRSGDIRAIGTATITALHPDQAAVDLFGGDRNQANRIATPVLLEWEEVRLLLGADVVDQDWEKVGQRRAALGNHSFLKVPHHGSREAVSSVYTNGPLERCWVVTPYSRSRLPRFDDDEGADRLLQNIGVLHLTGLPVRYDWQNQIPYRVSRQELRDGKRPPQVGESLPGNLFLAEQARPHDVKSCWVTAAFKRDGTLVEIRHGPGSIEISS